MAPKPLHPPLYTPPHGTTNHQRDGRSGCGSAAPRWRLWRLFGRCCHARSRRQRGRGAPGVGDGCGRRRSGGGLRGLRDLPQQDHPLGVQDRGGEAQDRGVGGQAEGEGGAAQDRGVQDRGGEAQDRGVQ